MKNPHNPRIIVFASTFLPVFLLGAADLADADTVRTTVHEARAQGPGAAVGEVVFSDSPFGVVVTPNLFGLPAGPLGAHIHENAECGPSAGEDGDPGPRVAITIPPPRGATKDPMATATSAICPISWWRKTAVRRCRSLLRG